MTRRPRPRSRPTAFRPRRPFPAPRRRRAPRGRARHALTWAAAFAVLTGGYGVLGPAVDDARSGVRPMATGCSVAYVVDGDTVELTCADRPGGRARLTGYDAPELFSPRCPAEAEAADRARRALVGLVGRSRHTEVAFLGTDRYDRALVDMRLDGRRVAAAMTEAGHGRRYLGGLRGGWC